MKKICVNNWTKKDYTWLTIIEQFCSCILLYFINIYIFFRCTTYDNCPYYGSPLGYVRHSNECISISSLSPSSLPLSETTIQKVLIMIEKLNVVAGARKPCVHVYSSEINIVKLTFYKSIHTGRLQV